MGQLKSLVEMLRHPLLASGFGGSRLVETGASWQLQGAASVAAGGDGRCWSQRRSFVAGFDLV